MKNIKETQRPEEPPGAAPEITPQMIQTVANVLESEGLVRYMKGGAYIPTERGWKFLREVEVVKEVIEAYGSEDILASDDKSFSIVRFKKAKEGNKSVIGVGADKGCVDLSDKFKDALKSARKIFITIEAGGESDTVTAFGSPALKLADANEIFIRKSDFIDVKTLAIFANKAAADLERSLKEKLKTPEKIKITLEVK